MAAPPSFIPDGEPAKGNASAPSSFIPDSEDAQLQAKHGGLGGELGAAAEGAAQTLTFGQSTELERRLGIKGRDIAGRAKANPTASTVGGIAGAVIPSLLTLGAAAPEEAAALGLGKGLAEVSVPSLISSAGEGVGGLVKSLLPKATSTLGKLGVKGAAGLAQGATEGGLYGAGHVAHEAGLGDPNLTAQSAIEEIGLSGLLGGGLGGGLHVAGGALGELGGKIKASDLGAKLSSWLEDFEGERGIKAAGGIQSDITQATKRMSKEELLKISREGRDLGILDKFTTPATALEKSKGAMDAAGEKMGAILDEADASGARPKSMVEIVDRAKKEVIDEMAKSPFQEGAAKKLANVLGQYESKFADEGSLSFKALHQVRKEVSDELYGLKGVMDPDANYYKMALHQVRTAISDELSKGLDKAGLGSRAWKAANREYQVGATLSKFAEKGMARSHGNNLIPVTSLISGLAGAAMHGLPGGALLGAGAYAAKRYGSSVLGAAARTARNMLDKEGAVGLAAKTVKAIEAEQTVGGSKIAQEAAQQAPETVAALSHLEKANQTVQDRISAATRAILTNTPRAAKSAGAVALAKRDSSPEERAEHVTQLAQNPQMMLERLNQTTDGLHEHAPQTAQAATVAQSRAVAFLASKAPPANKPGPLADKPEMNQAQKWQFNRYYDAVDKPTIILEHARTGQLTPLDVEAVKTVYPELYGQMQKTAMEQLATLKTPLPYKNRFMLSMLLGQDLDGTGTQAVIASNQAIYSLPSSKGGQDSTGPGALGKTTQSGLSKLNVAGIARLPGQSRAARTEGE